ncbi:protein kinase domain-containing protein [Streptomyces sp. NPDC002536]
MRVLAGRYELVAFVGRGGMGEVWEGRDRVIGRRVAVKLLPHHRDDPGGAELFFREARTAGALNHRGVVTVHDMGQDSGDGTLFLVMEYIEGRDLAAVLRADGPPPVQAVAEWAAQAAAALAAAHAAGVVHRDLKPANLMLTSDGEVKVLDFGIARYMAASDKSSKVMGTLAYMAPERFAEESGDARSDLYAFGCVLHELLTGATPFQATGPVTMMTAHLNKAPVPPSRLRTDVPAALDALVLRLLAKTPADRPASAAEVHAALRALPIAPPAVPTVPDAPRKPPVAPHDLPTRTAATPTPTPTPPRPAQPPSAAKAAEPRLPTRRRALWLGLGAAAVAATGTTAALLYRDGDPDTKSSAGQGREAPAGGGVSASPAVRPWRFDMHTPLPSVPVLSGGTLHFTDGQTIYSLDALTGSKLGAIRMPNEVSQLGVADGIVYVGDERDKLHAVNGSDKWQFAAQDRIRSRPAIADGTVFFSSLDKNVYAVDAATGARKWSFATGEEIFCSPAVADGTVYIGVDGEGRSLYALDAKTGAKKWAYQEGVGFPYPPAVGGGLVYSSGNDDTLYAFDAATGTKRWSVPFKRKAGAESWYRLQPPAFADGTVFVGGSDYALHALDARTGAQKWDFVIGGPILPSTPAVADGKVYVADLADSLNGIVYAVDAGSGGQRWSVRTGASVNSLTWHNAPVAANGFVYVTNEKGLLAIDAATGTLPS